mmetsp:Transcript_15686/g.31797  ORF Transcript_15686/g.31797 Transcript_15686/m.31797 type:complete len:213 (+) Transcript_15686:123-761(+)
MNCGLQLASASIKHFYSTFRAQKTLRDCEYSCHLRWKALRVFGMKERKGLMVADSFPASHPPDATDWTSGSTEVSLHFPWALRASLPPPHFLGVSTSPHAPPPAFQEEQVELWEGGGLMETHRLNEEMNTRPAALTACQETERERPINGGHKVPVLTSSHWSLSVHCLCREIQRSAFVGSSLQQSQTPHVPTPQQSVVRTPLRPHSHYYRTS